VHHHKIEDRPESGHLVTLPAVTPRRVKHLEEAGHVPLVVKRYERKRASTVKRLLHRRPTARRGDVADRNGGGHYLATERDPALLHDRARRHRSIISRTVLIPDPYFMGADPPHDPDHVRSKVLGDRIDDALRHLVKRHHRREFAP
jgi:hypothetical protein